MVTEGHKDRVPRCERRASASEGLSDRVTAFLFEDVGHTRSWVCSSTKFAPFTSFLLFLGIFPFSLSSLSISLASSWWPYRFLCAFCQISPRAALLVSRHSETRKLHRPWKWSLENYSRLLAFGNTIHRQEWKILFNA